MWWMLAQLVLILCWYLVPAFEHVSAWLIFLPIEGLGLIALLWFIFFGGFIAILDP